MPLVIGGRGLVGTALCAELAIRDIAFTATCKRLNHLNEIKLDVDPEHPDGWHIPPAMSEALLLIEMGVLPSAWREESDEDRMWLLAAWGNQRGIEAVSEQEARKKRKADEVKNAGSRGRR